MFIVMVSPETGDYSVVDTLTLETLEDGISDVFAARELRDMYAQGGAA
jgi:hypothetical protein